MDDFWFAIEDAVTEKVIFVYLEQMFKNYSGMNEDVKIITLEKSNRYHMEMRILANLKFGYPNSVFVPIVYGSNTCVNQEGQEREQKGYKFD